MTAVAQAREEWLSERRNYLGATDLAAVAGFHKYKSPLEVFLEKTGRKASEDPGAYAMVGIALEPVVAQLYELGTNRTLVKGEMVRHPDYPFIACNPDYNEVDRPRTKELKTYGFSTAKEWGEDGTDTVPVAYWAQGQIQCRLLTLHHGEQWQTDVIGFHRDKCEWSEHPIPVRNDVSDLMIEKGVKFWHDHVLADVPPSISGMECDTEWLKEAFPVASVDCVFSNAEIDRVAEQLMDLLGQANPLYKKAKDYENQIKEFMGDAQLLETIVGRFTWKNDRPKSVTDWDSLMRELSTHDPELALALLEKHTTTKPGSRRFNKPGANS